MDTTSTTWTHYAALNTSMSRTEPVQRPSPTPASANANIAVPMESMPDKDRPDAAELRQAITDFNTVLKAMAVNLSFMIDNETGRTVVKLVDTESNTVLRQYPTEQALAIAKQIEHFQEGLLIKTQA